MKVTPVTVTRLGGSKMTAVDAAVIEQIAAPFKHCDTRLWSSSRPISPVIRGKEVWFADTSAEQIGALVP